MQTLCNIYILSKYTYIEAIRHRVLWAIIVFSAILAVGNVFVTELFGWDLGKVSVEFGLSSVSFTGLLIVFFLGLKILADDLERDRIFMILSKPVSIHEYLLGKYLGLSFVLFVVTGILIFSSSLSMLYFLKYKSAFVPVNFSWQIYFMSVICQLASLIIMLAVCLLCFTFASHTFIALLLSILIYFVGQNMELLRKVINENAQAGVVSGQKWLINIVSWTFPNLSLFDKKYVAAYGLPFPFEEFLFLSLYCFSYSAILVFLATIVFKRKELAC